MLQNWWGLPGPLPSVESSPGLTTALFPQVSPGNRWPVLRHGRLATGYSGTQPKRWSSALQILLLLGKCPEQQGKKRPPSPPQREGGESTSQDELCSGDLDVSVLFVIEKHLLE